MSRNLTTIPDYKGEDKKAKALRERALKKVHAAIDKMIDLQDMGLGNGDVSAILDALNGLQSKFGG